MNKFFKFLIIICAIIIFQLITVELPAQNINARFTTSVYTWEQQESKTESATHVRAYQLAQISIGKLGLPGLSFHSYFNLSHDFSEKAVDDPRIWLYNCYFNLKTLRNTTDFSVGRQRIYAGVGYGTIDGLQVKYRFKDYFNLKVYAGTLAPLRKSYEMEELNSDNISFGFHLTSAKLKIVRIGISYARFSRTPVRYKTAGIYTSNFRLEHPVSSLQKHLIGLDLKSFITTKLKVQGRLDYNFAMHTIKRGEIGGRYEINKTFEIGLDYIYRMPSIDLNSIFSVFTIHQNEEIAFRTRYRWKNYNFFVNYALTFFEGENNHRRGLGCSWKSLYFGYNNRNGYGGDSDAITLNYMYPLKEKLNLTIGTYFASYKIVSSEENRNNLIGSSLGCVYRMNKKLTLQANVQFLKNKLFSQDFRFFFRGSYAFFHRSK
ncbi:hypothetical protein ISS22_07000 [candidate division KSB1 bacterium]|nr:hypothetical protein [candidate division KSB1 bacterium]